MEVFESLIRALLNLPAVPCEGYQRSRAKIIYFISNMRINFFKYEPENKLFFFYLIF